VLATIDFDRQFRRGAVEVENVWPELMLATKFGVGYLTTAHGHPDGAFGIRRVFA
jgi:hypothetical protein